MKVDSTLSDSPSGQNILKYVFRVAAPIMLGALFQGGHGVIDSLFVGRYVGDAALAALSINQTIFVSLVSLGALFGMGSGSIISRSLGARDYKKVHSVLSTGVLFGFLVAWSVSLLLLANLDAFLMSIGSSAGILALSKEYGSILLSFGFLLPVNEIFFSALRAAHKTKSVMIAMICGYSFNIVLDYIFIVHMGWGLAGAARATIAAQAAMLLFLAPVTLRAYNVSLKSFIPTRASLGFLPEIIAIGTPAAFRSGLFAFMNLSSSRALMNFGDNAISAFGVVYRVMIFAYIPVYNFNLGVQAVIGYFYGKGDFAMVQKIIRLSNISAVLMGCLPAIFFLMAPESFYRMFTQNDEIIVLIRQASFVVGTTFPLYGFQMVSAGSMIAMGHAFESFLVLCMRPFLLALSMNFVPGFVGVVGVWLSFPLTDLLNSAFTSYFNYKEKKELQSLEWQKTKG